MIHVETDLAVQSDMREQTGAAEIADAALRDAIPMLDIRDGAELERRGGDGIIHVVATSLMV
jgi:hypothetical protein